MASSSADVPPTSCDGTPLASLAKRVPAYKSACDKGLDLLLDTRRNNFIRIIDKLSKNPAWINPMHDHMMNSDYDKVVTLAGKASDTWTGDYKLMGKFPLGWRINVLAQKYENHVFPITKAFCDLMIAAAPTSIDILWQIETQTALKERLPVTMGDVNIAHKTICARSAELGNRIALMIQKGGIDRATGLLDLRKGGCYRLEFTEHRCTRVHHISGASVDVPAHVTILDTFQLKDNHLDFLAMAVLHPNQMLLMDLFPGSAHFKTLIINGEKKQAKLTAIAASAIAAEQAAELAKTAGVNVIQDVTFNSEAKKRKTKDNLLRARQSLNARKADEENQRTFSLAEPTP
jgi:hypothetical protein